MYIYCKSSNFNHHSTFSVIFMHLLYHRMPPKLILCLGSLTLFLNIWCFGDWKGWRINEGIQVLTDPYQWYYCVHVLTFINYVFQNGLFEDIAEGLLNAKIMVACVSDEYAMSPNCQFEFRFAANTLKLPIVLAVMGTGNAWRAKEVNDLNTIFCYVLGTFYHEIYAHS